MLVSDSAKPDNPVKMIIKRKELFNISELLFLLFIAGNITSNNTRTDSIAPEVVDDSLIAHCFSLSYVSNL